MATTFGDFVFKITAPVKNAIDNIKRWDKVMTVSMKKREKEAKEQEKNITFLQKTWKNFSTTALASFSAFSAFVMVKSPHIRAHLSIIGLHMRMLAMDVGKTWAPAFRIAERVIRKLVATWREWGRVSEEASEEPGSAGGILGKLGMSEKTVENAKGWTHEIVNVVGGILAITGFFAIVGQWVYKLFGGEGTFITALQGFIPPLKGVLGKILSVVISPWAAIVALVIAGIWDAWNRDFMGIRDDFDKVWGGIKKIWDGWIQEITGIYDTFIALVTGDTEGFKEGLKDIWEGIVKQVEGFWDVYTGIPSIILKGIADLIDRLGTVGENIKKVVDETIIQPALDWGADFLSNFVEGISAKSLRETAKLAKIAFKLLNPFSFDVRNNDIMAQRWGKDMVSNFTKGINEGARQVVVNQRLNSNITINNTGGGDPYSTANLSRRAVSEELGKLKGLGTQYY